MSYALLKIIASTSLGNVPTGIDAAFPQWTGPDPAIVHVQAILYSSLAASLLAAFIAMLGKQWLTRFAQVDITGSISDRSRNRVRKLDGMVTWHFDLVMECLPLMLQLALFLLGYALSNYLFFVNKVVAGVLIGFTAFGLLFYSLIVFAATLSYTCPFQTPLSLVIRFMIRFDDEHRRYLRRSRKRIQRMFSFCWKWKQPKPRAPGPGDLERANVVGENIANGPIELAMIGPHGPPLPLFDEAVRDGYVLDSASIVRLFGISTDSDVVLAITKFVPEIVWHDGIRTTPLEKIYDTVLECFDRSSGRLVVIPKFRNEAYFAAKALVHLAIQRQCFDSRSDQALIKSISDRHQVMGAEHPGGDSDLESTLTIVDGLFANEVFVEPKNLKPTPQPNFSPTTTHLAWMSHILLYRAWDAHRKCQPLPEYVKQFVLCCLRLGPPPPKQILVDCLFIIGLVLRIDTLRIGDLLVTDKSRFLQTEKSKFGLELLPEISKINRIYQKLVETFKNPSPSTDEVDRALEAMELITPLPMGVIASNSYRLFHVVMHTPISDAYSRVKRWQAARHAMHGACKWDGGLERLDDPQDILTFLNCHISLIPRPKKIRDEAIQNAMRAVAYDPGPATIEALELFDSTNPFFLRGIPYAFEGGQPLQLRKAALLFLPLIGDKWFNNTPYPIMEPDQMNSFCVDWASAIDSVDSTPEIQKAVLAALFGMINSSHWRPHIFPDKSKLLEYFSLVPNYHSKPFRRCLDNPEVTSAISEMGDPAAMSRWLAILWVKYTELIPQVREQSETVTKEVTQGDRATDFDIYLSAIDSGLNKVRDSLARYRPVHRPPAAVALYKKIDTLEQARTALLALKRDQR